MLEVKALGRLELISEGSCLPLPATLKSCSLLLYLLVNRERDHHRNQLADMFWGNRTEQKARRSLTTALWHIRRALPDKELIWSDYRTVGINPNSHLVLDFERFSDLATSTVIRDQQAAVELYQGEFLDGFYDDWVISERYRLEAILIDTLIQLMDRYEQDRLYEAALNIATQLIERDPLREEAHRVAMRVYCKLGQRNQAIAQYHHCRRIVMEQLKMSPLAETEALYQAIASGEITIEANQPGKAVRLTTPVRPGYSPLDFEARSKLIGREQEEKLLDNFWRAASDKRGGLLLIGGEAGLGKTLLLNYFADSLRWSGTPVLWGCCFQFERILPYQPLTEALQSILPHFSEKELAGFPDWTIKEIARLVPELTERRPELTHLPFTKADQDQTYLFNATSQFLTHLANFRPLLMVFEDLHWASKSTLAFIHFLHRQATRERILLAGSYRPEELDQDHPLLSLIQILEQEQPERSLHLSPLSLAEVSVMIEDMAGGKKDARSLARRLHQESEGNPFYIMELVKSQFERGLITINNDQWQGDFPTICDLPLPLPRKVRSVIRERVNGLGDLSSEGLCRAIILGREFDFDVLQEMWGKDIEETLEVVDTLLRRRLIAEGEGPTARDYVFTHHKIQEVLYEQMPRVRRQHFHALAGAALEKHTEAFAERSVAEIAYHFKVGQILDKALIWYDRAGDQARDRYALDEAKTYYSQSLVLIEQIESGTEEQGSLLLKRAKVLLLLAELGLARADLAKALTIYRPLNDQAKVIDLLLIDAECLIKLGCYADAATVAYEAHSLALLQGDLMLTGRARRWQGEALRWLGRGGEARQFLEEACRLLSEINAPQTLAWAHFSFACNSICLLGEIDSAIPHLEQAGRLFQKGLNRLGELQTIHHWGRLKFLQRDVTGSINEYSRALEMAGNYGLQVQESILNGELLVSHLFLGDLERAEEYAERCLLSSLQKNEKHWQGHAKFWWGVISYELGDFEAARRRLENSLKISLELSHQPGIYLANKQLALMYRRCGRRKDLQKALAYAEAALSAVRHTGDKWHELQAQAYLAITYAALNEWDQALAWARQASDFCGEPADIFFFDEYLFTLAQVYRDCNQGAEAARYLLAAQQEMQARAEKIFDLELKKAFMENLWVNRAILAAVESWTAGVD